MQEVAAYLYTDNGIIASPCPESLQMSFDVLTDLFNQVVLCTNMRKMVSVVCWPCHTPGGLLEAAYEQRVTVIVQ